MMHEEITVGVQRVAPDIDLPLGCVVLAHGPTGTALQRFYSDGLFRKVGTTQTYTEQQVREMPNLMLILAPR